MSAPRKLSPTAKEILATVLAFDGHCDGWGEIYSHCDPTKAGALEMRNFDRCSDALVKHGFLAQDDYGISLTDAGRAALTAAKALAKGGG